MAEEIKALENNQTWEIVDLPHGKRPISCKWIYLVKYNSKVQFSATKHVSLSAATIKLKDSTTTKLLHQWLR